MAGSKKKGPTSATLWAYDVGFGDCLLLEVGYANATRFVLFDFGSKGAAKGKGAGGGLMLKVAEDIEKRVLAAKKGSLVAIVATHRHQDHISGFMPGAGNKGPGSVIARLKPKVVVQPWTDTPSAPPTWRGPDKPVKKSGADALGLAPATLSLVHEFAQLAEAAAADDGGRRFARNTAAGILSAAGNNVPNLPAVKLLEKLCPKESHDYVWAGSKARNLSRVLPGVSISVLGPPTLNQYDALFRAYAKKSPEYWQLRAQLGDEGAFWQRAVALQAFAAAGAASGGKGKLFPRAKTISHPPSAGRWLVQRMDRDRGESMFELVRAADAVLNNTSVILLLKIGQARLLFPGDAQLESWEYALKHAKNAAATRKELEQTDLYKVGHHGSLNATPKASLWGEFKKLGPASKKNRMATVLSTATGYFGGKGGAETEVPRKPFVRELKAKSDYHSTQEPRKKGELAVRVDVRL